MNYNELSKEEKSKLKNTLKEKCPNSIIDVNEIKLSKEENNLKINYEGVNLDIPLRQPDQATTNEIWKMLTVGVIAIAGVIAGGISNK